MSKKKTAKKKTPDDLRSVCQDIVDQLFAEVDRVHSERMDEMNARLQAVEAKVAGNSSRSFRFRWFRREVPA